MSLFIVMAIINVTTHTSIRRIRTNISIRNAFIRRKRITGRFMGKRGIVV